MRAEIEMSPVEGNADSLAKVTEYVRRNQVAPRPGRKCVDGRDEEDAGMIARPGGDLGYVMALDSVNEQLGLGLTPEQCFDLVYDAVTADGEQFNMHSDDHTEQHLTDPENIGCGHAKKAEDPTLETDYGIDSGRMRQIVSYARQRIADQSAIHLAVYKGPHQEKATIMVTDPEVAVKNQADGQMYFMYDQARDDAFMKDKLLPKFNLPGVTYENFKAASDQQLQATLRQLALGQTIYSVGKNLAVAVAGRVEAAA